MEKKVGTMAADGVRIFTAMAPAKSCVWIPFGYIVIERSVNNTMVASAPDAFYKDSPAFDSFAEARGKTELKIKEGANAIKEEGAAAPVKNAEETPAMSTS